MSYHKMTTICGRRAGYIEPTAPVGTDERYAQIMTNHDQTVIAVLSGHWKPESALGYARRRGVVGPVEVTYSTADMSGKGRGGYDSALIVDESGSRPRPLTQAEREYDDAEDVHAAWDAGE